MVRHFLPALRGVFGDWAYYSCLMSLRELSARVSFADQIHHSKALSELIQRKLKDERADDISKYLKSNPERFFNSLVVAVYGGDPAWHELDEIKPQHQDFKVSDVSKDAIASLGFLSLTGDERLFALDGQHRLAGIQKAVLADEKIAEDEVSVIFVSHRNDTVGMRRTRALFTTLNKTAKPVNKSEIIALDESDVMAITVRRLIESNPSFSDKRILVIDSPNLPVTNTSHLTTIQNLYDVLTILFSKVMQQQSIKSLSFQRPKDDELEEYYNYAIGYFSLLEKSVPELAAFFKASNGANVVAAQRTDVGGSVLFRPVGMTMFAHIAETLVKSMDLPDAIKLMGRLPRDLNKAPYKDLLWDRSSGTLNLKREPLVRRLLLYTLGYANRSVTAASLRAEISKATGEAAYTIKLPVKIK
ncbi:DGQHR domain-containing protein [Sphingomonas faeni]|uniref:DGQHR domain-containing protein n=1 Tax=Sphingomonas faeni TaxID=185950 RepID=UPI003346BD00